MILFFHPREEQWFSAKEPPSSLQFYLYFFLESSFFFFLRFHSVRGGSAVPVKIDKSTSLLYQQSRCGGLAKATSYWFWPSVNSTLYSEKLWQALNGVLCSPIAAFSSARSPRCLTYHSQVHSKYSPHTGRWMFSPPQGPCLTLLLKSMEANPGICVLILLLRCHRTGSRVGKRCSPITIYSFISTSLAPDLQSSP